MSGLRILIVLILILIITGVAGVVYLKIPVPISEKTEQPKSQSVSVDQYIDQTFPKATQEEKNFLKQVQKYDPRQPFPPEIVIESAKFAKVVDLVMIKDCRFDPIIVKSHKGAQLLFKNNDPVEHALKIDSKSYPIASSGGMIKVSLPSASSAALIRYRCEIPPGVGFIYLP